jgi:hypothetical protein
LAGQVRQQHATQTHRMALAPGSPWRAGLRGFLRSRTGTSPLDRLRDMLRELAAVRSPDWQSSSAGAAVASCLASKHPW